MVKVGDLVQVLPNNGKQAYSGEMEKLVGRNFRVESVVKDWVDLVGSNYSYHQSNVELVGVTNKIKKILDGEAK